MYGTWHSSNTFPTVVHGLVFRIMSTLFDI
jgi:hypothetical protein